MAKKLVTIKMTCRQTIEVDEADVARVSYSYDDRLDFAEDCNPQDVKFELEDDGETTDVTENGDELEVEPEPE